MAGCRPPGFFALQAWHTHPIVVNQFEPLGRRDENVGVLQVSVRNLGCGQFPNQGVPLSGRVGEQRNVARMALGTQPLEKGWPFHPVHQDDGIPFTID